MPALQLTDALHESLPPPPPPSDPHCTAHDVTALHCTVWLLHVDPPAQRILHEPASHRTPLLQLFAPSHPMVQLPPDRHSIGWLLHDEPPRHWMLHALASHWMPAEHELSAHVTLHELPLHAIGWLLQEPVPLQAMLQAVACWQSTPPPHATGI